MHLEVLQTGPFARRALARAGPGRVLALFERSGYLELPAGLLCLGGESLGSGPLNLSTSARAALDWRSLGLELGSSVGLDEEGRLDLDGRVTIDSSVGALWSPPDTAVGPPHRCVAALDIVLDLASESCPDEGLAPVFLGRPGSGVGHAAVALGDLATWLSGAFDEVGPVPSSVTGLLGLGPGLTPSGDDLLGGTLITLRALDRGDLAERLYAAIEGDLAARTHAISRAHLEAAAEGLGGAILHAMLATLLAGRHDELPARLSALDAIGHCSGWDGLAGVILVLQAWSRSAAIELQSEARVVA